MQDLQHQLDQQAAQLAALPVGSGDTYNAGFRYGLLTGDMAKAVSYGDAMSAIKHSVPGDHGWRCWRKCELTWSSHGPRLYAKEGYNARNS